MPMIPYDEEDAIKRVLRHHHVPVSRKLVDDLADLLSWVHESEQASVHFGHPKPPFLLVLLSKLGIYGKEISDTVGVDGA